MPKISIIIPVYKVEKYLHRCLDSIVNQTFTDWECFLVDDGSPDNSGKICDEYAEKDNRFRVFHQENQGVSAARNKGLDEAKGEWINFIDSDDWIEKEMLAELYDCAVKNEAEVVISGNKRIYENKIYEERLDKTGWILGENSFLYPAPYAKLYSANLLNKFNIRFPLNIALSEDKYFTFLICINCTKIFVLHKYFYNYFQNTNSASHNISEKMIYDNIKIAELMEQKLTELNATKQWFYRLNFEKVNVRNAFVLSIVPPRCDLWRKTFPETNLFSLLHRKGRIVYILLLLHCDFLVKWIAKIYRRKRK